MRRLWLLVLVLFLGGVVFAVYSLRIDAVRVTGLRTLPARAIVDASGLKPGERILWVRLSAAERRVEAIPAVARVVAERSLPGTIVIHVTERVPLVRLDSRPTLVADKTGALFGAIDAKPFPLLSGWRGKAAPAAMLDAQSRAVLEAFGAFPERLIKDATKVTVRPGVVVTLRGGLEVRFGSPDDLLVKARAANAVLAAEHGNKLQYVDVSSPAVPVSRDFTPVTPTPAPPGATPVPGATPPVSTPVPAASPRPTQ